MPGVSAFMERLRTGAPVEASEAWEAVDPRPDLSGDAWLWEKLLPAAGAIAPDLAGLLHGLRCGGARLAVDQQGRLQVRRGEWSADEWAGIKARWIAPVGRELAGMLGAIVVRADLETRR